MCTVVRLIITLETTQSIPPPAFFKFFEDMWSCVDMRTIVEKRGYEDLCGYEEMLIWGYEDHASNVVWIWPGHVPTLKTGWDRVGILLLLPGRPGWVVGSSSRSSSSSSSSCCCSQGGQGDILQVAAQRDPSILSMGSRGQRQCNGGKGCWRIYCKCMVQHKSQQCT